MTEIAAGRNALKIVGLLDSAKLGVHPERCLMVRHKNAGCLRCAEVCTTGAIAKTDDGRMAVDPDKCIGCGTCATACPSGCLEAKNPSDAELERALFTALAAGRGGAVLACEEALAYARERAGAGANGAVLADNAPVVGIVCTGRAEEGMLVEAAARGAKRIALVHHECETCEHASGGRLDEAVCASACALLEAFGSSLAIERKAAKDVAWTPAPDTVTETVFAEITADATQEAAAATAAEAASFTHVQADGTLPHFVPPRRLRLFNSLKRLAGTADLPAGRTFTTRLWGQVTINTELCRSCRMCTVFCPTGAVARFDAANGAFGVEHRSALCMQCRLCETICPEQAITVSDTVSLAEFISGKKFRFEMQPVGWRPNDSDAVASRVVRFLNTDVVQDPEARITAREVIDSKRYAEKRDARRAEIRAEQGE